jgi:hypothetical protein
MLFVGFGSGLVMPTMSLVIQNSVSPALMGVATSSRQFFMQIGNVLGAAIFGVVLASSYATSFDERVSEQVRTTLPPATYDEFKDPTLSLNERAFARVQAEVNALPDGPAILAQATEAQREGVAEAVRHIFIGATAVVAVAFFLAMGLKELPLRRGAPSGAPIPVPGATRPAAAGRVASAPEG